MNDNNNQDQNQSQNFNRPVSLQYNAKEKELEGLESIQYKLEKQFSQEQDQKNKLDLLRQSFKQSIHENSQKDNTISLSKTDKSISIKDSIKESFQRQIEWQQLPDRQIISNSDCIQYKSNYIQTRKYTWYTFIFINLFEQFRRFSNFYFLIMGLLEMIPEISNSGGLPVLYLPLAFIIIITGIKDFVEDWKRHASDLKENQQIVLKGKSYQQIQEQQLNNQNRNTMDTQKNNIKKTIEQQAQKISRRKNSTLLNNSINQYSQEIQDIPSPQNEDYELFENSHIDTQPGSIFEPIQSQYLRVGNIVKIKKNQIIPADMILMYTSNNNKQAYVETKNLDGETNLKSKAPPKQFQQQFQNEDQCLLQNGTLMCEHPNPFLYKFEGIYDFHRSRSNSRVINYQNPTNNSLNKSQEIQQTVSLTYDNLLLRGCTLKNTKYIIGIVCYTGHETKIFLNANNPRSKRSKVELKMNKQILLIIAIQCFLCLFCSVFNIIWQKVFKDEVPYLDIQPNDWEANSLKSFFIGFGTWLMLFMNLIPISLMITLDMVRIIQGYMMSNDKKMVSIDGIPPDVQGSNLNEDLGQIQCIFSDKTGTLTCNIMNFKCIWIDKYTKFGDEQSINTIYTKNDLNQESDSIQQEDFTTKSPYFEKVEFVNFEDNAYFNILKKIPENIDQSLQQLYKNIDDEIKHLADGKIIGTLICLSVCHTIELDMESNEYQASSPDELALLNFAKYSGYEFQGKDVDNVITILNHKNKKELRFKLENILEFNSDRKRMSVIVYNYQNSQLELYSKGADSVMLDRLSKQQQTQIDKIEIMQQLSYYSSFGLRTLVIGYKKLELGEFNNFQDKITQASNIIGKQREIQMQQLMNNIERDLQFLSITAIEDKLQDEVESTIQTLKQATMGFYILTGDKLETAINIGYSTGVIGEQDKLLILDYEQFQDLDPEMFKAEQSQDNALILQGETIGQIFESEEDKQKFSEITQNCKQVIACRVSPKQKKDIVEHYKKCNPNHRVLAIGDGANDVNMINEAHVGIGLKGKEGMQAARASDFSIGEFKLLKPLILYFGREYYRKNSILINYNFFKNAVYLFPNFWFGVFSGFCGSNIYDVLLYQGFNSMYCALPIMFYSALDTEFSKKFLVSNPKFYLQGIQDRRFNNLLFWIWFLQGIFYALIITLAVIFCTDSTSAQDHTNFLQLQGQMIFCLVIVTCNFKVILIHNHQFIGCIIVNILSTLIYFISLAVVSTWDSNELFDFFTRILGDTLFWCSAFIICCAVNLFDLAIIRWENYSYYQEIKQTIIQPKYGRKISQNFAKSNKIMFQSDNESNLSIADRIKNNLRQPLLSESGNLSVESNKDPLSRAQSGLITSQD